MPSTQKIRIFCASPTDVMPERKALREVIDELNLIYDKRGATLAFLGWEKNARPQQGRPQQRVLDQIPPASWDVFIGLLWKRFGQPTGADKPGGAPFESGLEEEFLTALDHDKKPAARES